MSGVFNSDSATFFTRASSLATLPAMDLASKMAAEKEKVCVTGAGGFLASWVVKLLLSKDFLVHGTVREPSDAKNRHLKKLHKADENLKLFKADLLDYNSLYNAIQGCKGVFHVASPVPSPSNPNNPEVELVEPAVTGTLNVLKACVEAKIKRVVVVSSIIALTVNPSWPEGQVIDESCWSDKDYCRKINKWYCLGKTEAESEAFEFAKRNGLDVVTLCPSVVLGPILQPTVNASTFLLVVLLKEGKETFENTVRPIVDVRDAAEALMLIYMKPGAEGRYLCNSHIASDKDVVEKLKSTYPNYNYPKNFIKGGEYYVCREDTILSSEKLQSLGWKYRSLEETLFDSVESYKNAGILQ